MPKFTSPSGETEFFKQTELQKAFEKELKTGEKVIITPGVKEASFLREAPIRAELAGVYAEFIDRVVNPLPVTQPPIDSSFKACNDAPLPAGFKRYISLFPPTGRRLEPLGPLATLTLRVTVNPYGQVYPRNPYFYDDPNELNPQWYGYTQGVWPDGTGRNATWPVWDGLYDSSEGGNSPNEGIGGYREIIGRKPPTYSSNQFFDTGIENIATNYPQTIPSAYTIINSIVGKTPSIDAYTISNAITIDLYVSNWFPLPIKGQLEDASISIGDSTGALYYASPGDTCYIPQVTGLTLVKKITCDLSMARFEKDNIPAYPYANCICQFSNFKYTNYFPNP
jgi:hypothetical protein